MNGATRLFAALLTCSVAMAAHAGIYKWVDAEGVTHYSENKPPQDAKNVKVIKASTTPSSDVDDARKKLDAQRKQALSDLEKKEKTAAGVPLAENRKALCDGLRNNLKVMGEHQRVREQQKDGSSVVLTPEQKAARLKELQDRLNNECEGS